MAALGTTRSTTMGDDRRISLPSVVSPILFKHHIWLFLENQNIIYGGHFLKNFA
jgi:hypothetical protein